MISQELSPAAQAAVGKIEKLLKLADKAGTPAEAAAAAGKAQELMELYNLEAATIERASGKTGEREKAMVSGGMYQYQRDLWDEVARLNFCMYFTRRQRVVVRPNYRPMRFMHQLIGRKVNVAATRVMGEYI